MIEFYGELSSNCKNYIIKKEIQAGVMVTSIIGTLFLIPILVATFLWDWIAIIALVPLIAYITFSFVRPSKKTCRLLFPNRISIEDDFIVSEGDNFSYACPVSEVKKVIDMGEWYHIFFNYRYRNPRFVCQKDLLKQGSINEFEKLFENKIIRKIEGCV